MRRSGCAARSRKYEVGAGTLPWFTEAWDELARVYEGVANWWLGTQDRDGFGGSDWEEEYDSDVDDGFEEGSVRRGEARVGAAVVGSGQAQPEFGLHSDGKGVVYGFWSKCWLG
jgi:hypothetical protein